MRLNDPQDFVVANGFTGIVYEEHPRIERRKLALFL